MLLRPSNFAGRWAPGAQGAVIAAPVTTVQDSLATAPLRIAQREMVTERALTATERRPGAVAPSSAPAVLGSEVRELLAFSKEIRSPSCSTSIKLHHGRVDCFKDRKNEHAQRLSNDPATCRYCSTIADSSRWQDLQVSDKAVEGLNIETVEKELPTAGHAGDKQLAFGQLPLRGSGVGVAAAADAAEVARTSEEASKLHPSAA